MKKVIESLTAMPDKIVVPVLLAVTFLLRLVYVSHGYVSNIMETFADDKGYLYLAKGIVERGHIFYDKNIHLYAEMIGPGLPWVNALTIGLFGDSWLPVFIVSSLLSVLITFFIYKLALEVIDRPTALLAGLWSCFYFFYISFSATAGKEILMALSLVVTVYLLLRLFYQREFSWPGFLILIFVYTYSFHLDERYLVFSPFIFLYILSAETDLFRVLRIRKSLVFFILVIALTIPWTIRNFNEFGKFVLISTRTEAYTDRLLGYEIKEHVIDKYNDVYGFFYLHDYQIDSVIKGLKTKTDGGYIISEEQRKAMAEGYLPHPLNGIKAFWIRTKDILRPFQIGGEFQRTGYFYYKKSFRHNLTSFLFYGTMLFLSFPGFYFLYRKHKHIFYFFLITLLIYTLLHGLLIPYTNWRYRLPLDFIIIITGSFGLIQALQAITRRKASPLM